MSLIDLLGRSFLGLIGLLVLLRFVDLILVCLLLWFDGGY